MKRTTVREADHLPAAAEETTSPTTECVRVTTSSTSSPLYHAPEAAGSRLHNGTGRFSVSAHANAKAVQRMLGSVDTVITVGAPQSNHARTVAAAARLVGWECHLMLGGDRPPRPSGNLVLDVVLGAELHFAGADDWSVLEAASIRLASELTAQGRHVLTIPIGGSTPSGALGFVAAYLELLDQIEQFGITDATIVHATSTGETQAGLDYAHRVLGSALSSILWSIRPRFRIAAPA